MHSYNIHFVLNVGRNIIYRVLQGLSHNFRVVRYGNFVKIFSHLQQLNSTLFHPFTELFDNSFKIRWKLFNSVGDFVGSVNKESRIILISSITIIIQTCLLHRIIETWLIKAHYYIIVSFNTKVLLILLNLDKCKQWTL